MNLSSLTLERFLIMKGRFTKNLFSLQLQLKTLLEDAGGDEALELLDTLCKLNPSEQNLVLKVMNRLVGDILNHGPRFETEGDLALKKFEDDLYGDLLRAMQQQSASEKRQKFEVVSGGKDTESTSTGDLIDLQRIRNLRKDSSNDDPIIN
ncbi:MAG: hypothetical protein R3A13_10575 [Bdellovibrionota bacterium]